MNEHTIFELSKKAKKVLKFLLSATNGDGLRPVLMGINFSENAMESADGWKYHWAGSNCTELKGLQEIKITGGLCGATKIEGDFPNTKAMIPRDAPKHEFAIDPVMLVDTLKHFTKGQPVIIRCREPHEGIEILGQIDDIDVYAIVMPMSKKSDSKTEDYITPLS